MEQLPSPLSPQNDFLEARPSGRVPKSKIEADGDIWQETLAVAEGADQKLQIRSYYQSSRGKRVWDEPPSGASHILPASEEMRKMAHMQLQEMQVVTGDLQNIDDEEANSSGGKDNRKSKPKRGLFGFGRKKEKEEKNKNAKPQQTQKNIQYRPGSKMIGKKSSGVGGGGGGGTRPSEDAQMQEAIARSIAESNGVEYNAAEQPVFLSHTSTQQEEEELQMAKALSMSESESRGEPPAASDYPTANNASERSKPSQEDVMLQQALEESRREAERAGLVEESKREVDLLGPYHHNSPTQNLLLDRKPSAKNVIAGLKSPPIYSSPPPAANLKSPPNYAAGSPAAAAAPPQNGLKSPPTYSQKSPPSYALKSPPNYTTSQAGDPSGVVVQVSPYAAMATTSPPDTPSPNYSGNDSKAPLSPVPAMFDPYAKDSASALPQYRQTKTSTQHPPTESTGIPLNKMNEDENVKARRPFGRKQSSKKMQDKAGLV
jgi:hypothetical protein